MVLSDSAHLKFVIFLLCFSIKFGHFSFEVVVVDVFSLKNLHQRSIIAWRWFWLQPIKIHKLLIIRRWYTVEIRFWNQSASRCAFHETFCIYGSRMCPSNVPQNKSRTRKLLFDQVAVFAHKTNHEGRKWNQIKRMWEPEEESVRKITVHIPLNANLLWKF